MSLSKFIYTRLFLFVFAVFATLGFADLNHAQAKVFVWTDGGAEVAVAFPDRWALVGNISTDDVLTIAAPQDGGVHENASCRLRLRDDDRFKMHPISHSDEIQRLYFGLEFWEDYTAEYTNARFSRVKNNAGLGRGFASLSDFTFETNTEPKQVMRGLAFAALYNDRVHIFECSSEHSVFHKWYPSFIGLVQTVKFAPVQIMQKRGYYRNFYSDLPLVIHGARPEDDYTF